MSTTTIGLKWAKRISQAFQAWAAHERLSRSFKIHPFDPSPLVEGAFYEAGEAQLTELGKLIGVGVSFDLKNPHAVAWIEKYSADQIKYISDGQRAAIRQIKTKAIQEGLSLSEQRKLIKQNIGLLPRHLAAVENYRTTLEGYGQAEADRLAAKYANQLLTYRANMIGVTEGMMAANEGNRKTNESAAERGIIDPDEYEQEWVATGLKNVCDECSGMNGKTAPIGGEFENGMRGPPLHPSCHCNTVLMKKYRRARSMPSEVREFRQSLEGLGNAEIEEILSNDFSWIDWNLKDADPVLARNLATRFKELATDYSNVAEGLGTIEVESVTAGAYAESIYENASIRLNNRWFSDHDSFKDMLTTDVERGFHVIGSEDPDSILTHEFGHMVDGWLKNAEGAEVMAWKEAHRELLEEVSDYAKTDLDEAFAEAFTSIYHTPIEQRQPITNELISYLDQMKAGGII